VASHAICHLPCDWNEHASNVYNATLAEGASPDMTLPCELGDFQEMALQDCEMASLEGQWEEMQAEVMKMKHKIEGFEDRIRVNTTWAKTAHLPIGQNDLHFMHQAKVVKQ